MASGAGQDEEMADVPGSESPISSPPKTEGPGSPRSPIGCFLETPRTPSDTRGLQSETPYTDWGPSYPPSAKSAMSVSDQSLNMSSLSFSANVEHLPFDEEFQRLTSEITDERILKEEIAFRSLSRLSRDFQFAATTYGKVIIAEKHLPKEQKTIKPQEDLPGWAGGEKYLAGGILFRFAVDKNGLYGSDELAGKEAAHQLRGLTEVVSAGIEGLHFPLMALIDYRGYRLLAVSRLPINGKQTLVMGSQDAGECILEGTEEAKSRMTALAKTLNLKKHRVLDKKGMVVHLHGPCDLEIHQGPESRLYAVDFARLFPPEPPSLFRSSRPALFRRHSTEADRTLSEEEDDSETTSQCRAPHLVKLLRPELVRTNETPLSADAFSNFGSLDRDKNDGEVLAAGTRLLSTCIPNAAQALSTIEIMDVSQLAREMRRMFMGNNADDEVSFSNLGGQFSTQSRDWISSVNINGKVITRTLHKHGVNMRHLGRVHAKCSAKWQRELLGEAVARCVKAKVRAAMRQTMRKVRTAVLTPFLSTVTEQLNTMLGAPPCSRPSSRSCTCAAACICLCTCSRTASPTTSVDSSQALHRQLQVHYGDTSEEEFRRRSRWWCYTIPQMLEERFGFKPHRTLLLLNPLRDAHSVSRCHCCACGFSRYVSRSAVFARVSEVCGMVLSPPLSSGLLHSLERNPRQSLLKSSSSSSSLGQPPKIASPSTPSSPPPVNIGGGGSGNRTQTVLDPCLFDFTEPFEEGAIMDVLGSIQVLPWLDYATGTALLIKAKNLKNAGAFSEARRLARTARESFESGLAQCPTDARLLCNFAFLLEDVLAEPEEALKLYEESVSKNPMHARSHYYLSLCLWRKYEKRSKGFRDPQLIARVQEHFTRAMECSPTNANILKDFGRFKWSQQKDTAGAMKLFIRALEVEPSHVRAHESLGTLYEEAGHLDKAREIWEKLMEVKCTFAESTQAKLCLARCLLKMPDKVQEAQQLTLDVLEDIRNYKLVNRGHSERPGASWAIKCVRLLVTIAQQLPSKEGRCSSKVHDIFETSTIVLSWFNHSVHLAHETKIDKAAAREAGELRKVHVYTLHEHANIAAYCECEGLDHRGMAEELHERAVAVDPSPATKWAKERFENGLQGQFEPSFAVFTGKASINAAKTGGREEKVLPVSRQARTPFNQIVRSNSTTTQASANPGSASSSATTKSAKQKATLLTLRTSVAVSASPTLESQTVTAGEKSLKTLTSKTSSKV